jgi:uncharacterized protein YqjF (DUF2071 family)
VRVTVTRVFLTAEWRDLAMLNFAIDPAILAPLVPRGTDLDVWRGITYISLVGFRFLHTALLSVPIPGHRNFEEVNLRFYVRRREGDEWRRGVVFVKELVPRRAIAAVARLWYNEPYTALPMRHRIDRHPDGSPDHVEYEWRRRSRAVGPLVPDGRASRAWEGFSLRASGPATPLEPGSEAEYITEHYWGYTRQRDGGAIEYEVRHPRWRVWPATDARVTCDVEALYGPAFAAALGDPPLSAFIAEGSPITVCRPRRLPDAG